MTEQPKWTPGPWTVRQEYDEESGGLIDTLALEGSPYIQPEYKEAGHVRDTVCVLGFSEHTRHRANLRLIAAAPELYEALSTLLTTHFAQWGDIEQAFQKAEAALTKARGDTDL